MGQPHGDPAARPAHDVTATGQLSEKEIVSAALRLAGRVGFNGVTMRGVAEELNVTPMAIYYYVQNKQALLQLVADAILQDIRIPSPEEGTWMQRLRLLQQESARVLSAYPGIDAMMIEIGLTEQGRRLMDANIQILLDAGFDERGALLAYNLIHSYAVGRISIESRLRGKRRAVPSDPPDHKHPALGRIHDEVPNLRAADYRAFGYEAILLGINEMLRRTRTEEGPSSAEI
jgi:TetR/AcrR family tetracycline transcriptional repressor